MGDVTASGKRSRLVWLLIGIVLAAGFWLRARNLTQQPFWLDEAYSAFAADNGYSFIWSVLPSYETHPPFYSAVLRSWSLAAGNTLSGFRSLGVFAGLLILPVVGMAGREMERGLGRRTLSIAIPAILLAAVLPSFVDTARLVRPYYLLTLANACGVWSVLRLGRVHGETGTIDRKAWWGYLGSLAMLFWLHNLGALYVAAIGLALLLLVGPSALLRNHWRQFLIGHALVLAVALPAFLILLDQAPTWAHSTWLRFDSGGLFDNILLIFGLPGLFGLAAAGLLGGATIATSAGNRMPVSLLIMVVIPLLLSLLLTLAIAPVFLPRTLVASGVPLVMLVAGSAARGTLARVTFALLVGMAFVRVLQVQNLPPEQDWYGAVRWLAPRFRNGDRIYAYPNEGALPLRYALKDLNHTVPIRQIPSEIPARDPAGWYPTGSRGVQSLTSARLTEIARDSLSRQTRTIWLLRLGPAAYDKRDNFLNILRRRRIETDRFTNGEIDIVGLRQSPQPTPSQKP